MAFRALFSRLVVWASLSARSRLIWKNMLSMTCTTKPDNA
jgi:hypothetical protein